MNPYSQDPVLSSATNAVDDMSSTSYDVINQAQGRSNSNTLHLSGEQAHASAGQSEQQSSSGIVEPPPEATYRAVRGISGRWEVQQPEGYEEAVAAQIEVLKKGNPNPISSYQQFQEGLLTKNLYWPLPYESLEHYFARQETLGRVTDRALLTAEYTAWRNSPKNVNFCPSDEAHRTILEREKALRYNGKTKRSKLWLAQHWETEQIPNVEPYYPPDATELAKTQQTCPLANEPDEWRRWRDKKPQNGDSMSQRYQQALTDGRIYEGPLPYESWEAFLTRRLDFVPPTLSNEIRLRAVYLAWWENEPLFHPGREGRWLTTKQA